MDNITKFFESVGIEPTDENVSRLIEIIKADDTKRIQTHRYQRAQNRKDYFEAGERKKRNHRLITKGAAMESIDSRLKDFSETEFYECMEKIMEHPYADRIVRSVISERSDFGG